MIKVKYDNGKKNAKFHRFTVIHCGDMILSTDSKEFAINSAEQIASVNPLPVEVFDTQEKLQYVRKMNCGPNNI